MVTHQPFDYKSYLASLPLLPGVYRMFDMEGGLLYVGKAGQLKKRVSSYFQKTNISTRIQLMVSHIARIEITVTSSEAEALLLENNLIKSLKPRYNILFRDDKSYPYIVFTGDKFPRLAYFRGSTQKQHQYFGPYPNSFAAKEAISLLQKIFQLRTCEESVFSNRTRPCLLHQIKRCKAPCMPLITELDYATDVQNAIYLLQGKYSQVESNLRAAMELAAEEMRYEQAAVLRDQLQSLSSVQQKQYMESGKTTDADIVVVAAHEGCVCVTLAMVRGGRHLGDKHFFPQNAEGESSSHVLHAFLAQQYLNREIPPLILVNLEIIEDELQHVLSDQAGHKIQIRQAISGERRKWVDMALNNALLALKQRLGQQAGQMARVEELRTVLSLSELKRVECFDISHTMGEATIASCVVYDDFLMRNAEYRRYNIAGITGGDDYAAMRQALLRRYQKLQHGDGKQPDLILIDGGIGQLNVAVEVMAELGLDIPLVGVAKGVERKAGMEQLIRPTIEKPLQLNSDSLALHLVQQIRDEAHRFAIAGHRSKRGKTRMASQLEEIIGVGEKRRRNLLARFGGLKGVRQASIEELAQVDGISPVLAKTIYQQFH
ncbi:MAG: excinuclease ABC subunit UvrC [Gallionellaceae bacterium]